MTKPKYWKNMHPLNQAIWMENAALSAKANLRILEKLKNKRIEEAQKVKQAFAVRGGLEAFSKLI